MIYIETTSKDAAFHFSVEEYIMRNYPWNEPVMMIWQTDKCAMLGNYQIAEAEIDINFARQKEIQIVRRSSGGGTIYNDLGTFLFSLIMTWPEEQYGQQTAQKELAASVVCALNKMKIPAMLEGRNDITVGGKKVSGRAQYARYGRICSHGSLLYDTDLDMLTRVLRVDEEKIRSKAIRSVRSRVTNIKEHMDKPCSTMDFGRQLKQELFSGRQIREYKLTEDDLKQINQIYHERYGNPVWTFEKAPNFTFHNSKRFTGGKVEVYLDIVKGTVVSCKVRGDFLGVAAITDLEALFENKAFQYEIFNNLFNEISLQSYLGNITKDEFLSCIFD